MSIALTIKLMKIQSLLIASIGIVSLNALSPAAASTFEYAGIADDIGNASVGVLTQLGYDCKTASTGGILCTKCEADGLKQKCEAFTCDAVSKKCRRKTADLPNVPGLSNDESSDAEDSNDGIKLPSL